MLHALPPVDFSLTTSELHLWLINHTDYHSDYLSYYGLLSKNEKRRVAQFSSDGLRQRFAITHGMLRCLLAQICETSPEDIDFTVNSYGKPYMANSDISFSLSYTQRYALIALARGRAVGVDIEKQRHIGDMSGLMTSILSPAEQQNLMRLQEHARHQAFFDIWVRKEAFVKAVGKGLSFPLDKLCVSVSEPVRILSIHGDTDAANDWCLSHVPVPAGWSAAVAYRGSAAEHHLWSLP